MLIAVLYMTEHEDFYFLSQKPFWRQVELSNKRTNYELKPPKCWNVLKRAIQGKWISKHHDKKELEKINKFFQKTRSYHRIPLSLQRNDGKCGNISFKGTKMHHYRALCDPEGSTPCCHNNHTCVAFSQAQCVCDGCYDMRRSVHAELATWVPRDKTCKLNIYTGEEDLCPVLKNTVIHFVGDSYIRQFFIAFLSVIRSGHPDRIFAYTNTSADVKAMCDPYYSYFRSCKLLLPSDVPACDGSVKLCLDQKFLAHNHAKEVLRLVKSYKGKPNSVVVLWMGAWDWFNAKRIIKLLVKPMKMLLKGQLWPHLIWVSGHSPGLLKAPKKVDDAEAVFTFNHEIEKVIDSQFPILDTFFLTKKAGVMSYDGSHYGPGVNDVKAQLLFNYLNEMRTAGNFKRKP
ncbi:hypothetical protein PoB_003691700 [Plakobranchus ocellatus]|uniref:Uncharacterized protein n=1 Tax=Plakobranchus ocellatus TaxID=259542 RepID=A0AAV4AU02_9GAST|nr:hypothetical protein PoB_003691700 [Plakobranchus ocellatus]